ncbi:MAG: hypothetical protein QW303_00030 [Nitrososphaerota archaeon]
MSYLITYDNRYCLKPKTKGTYVGDSEVALIDCFLPHVSPEDYLWKDKQVGNYITTQHLSSGQCIDVNSCNKGYDVKMRDCNGLWNPLPWVLSTGDNKKICCSRELYNCIGPIPGNLWVLKLFGPDENKNFLYKKVDAENLKKSCCRGETTDLRCGVYKPGSNECNKLMSTLCASTIKSGNEIKPIITTDPICTTWCQNNPYDCSTIKLNFCKTNPSSPLCDCINASSRSEFKALYDKLPPNIQGIPASCFLQSRCGEADLSTVLIPQSVVEEKKNCPKTLINMEQDIKCTNSVCIGVGGQQQLQQNSTYPDTSFFSNLLYNPFIWFFLIILIVLLLIFILKDENIEGENGNITS